jgi:hypothetical protein
MKTWLVTDIQQRKQWVYNIPRDFGSCCMNETGRSLELIKEHKYNLIQGLVEK